MSDGDRQVESGGRGGFDVRQPLANAEGEPSARVACRGQGEQGDARRDGELKE